MGILKILDMTTEEANQYVQKWHRHSDPVPRVQVRFALKLLEIDVQNKGCNVIGVAMVGNPCGRPSSKNIIELRRVAFNPEVSFGHIRRHYNDRQYKTDLSKRRLPIIISTDDLYKGNVIQSRETPSTFLTIVEDLIKIRLPHMHTIWTYVHDYEKAKYIEHAGYNCDHKFVRREIPKRRYSKSLIN